MDPSIGFGVLSGVKTRSDKGVPKGDPVARFWSKTQRMPVTDCLVWTGAINRRGYGWVNYIAVHYLAHRLAYKLAVGPIPDGMNVCHSCDNPPCINPEHLFLGTQRDNTEDRDRKGRTYNGQADKTHCVHGHEFTAENTYHRLTGGRSCRTCMREGARSRNGYRPENYRVA